jgi:hypothetical protein
MAVMFSKAPSSLGTYFKKGGTGNVFFRKGLNTLDKIGNTFTNASNIGSKIAPVIGSFNSGLGASVLGASGISGAIGNVVNNYVSKGRAFKKSIEKGELEPLIKKNQ